MGKQFTEYFQRRDIIKFTFNGKGEGYPQAAVNLVEQQALHSKGRFIANVVLHYVRCSETPDVSIRPSLDRMAVEKIILDILRQRGLDIKEPEPVPCPAEQAEPEEKKTSRPELIADEPIKSDVDESTRALIQNTLFAFRSNS